MNRETSLQRILRIFFELWIYLSCHHSVTSKTYPCFFCERRSGELTYSNCHYQITNHWITVHTAIKSFRCFRHCRSYSVVATASYHKLGNLYFRTSATFSGGIVVRSIRRIIKAFPNATIMSAIFDVPAEDMFTKKASLLFSRINSLLGCRLRRSGCGRLYYAASHI